MLPRGGVADCPITSRWSPESPVAPSVRFRGVETRQCQGTARSTPTSCSSVKAPGFHEDRQGLPFVGQAGNLLNEMLALIGLARGDVYITNMIKCRPPNNRDPFPVEISSCRPYLDEQIEMIEPKVIVTLGRFSFSKFFPGEAIGKARGKPRNWNGLVVYPMYHPAAALRNPRLKTALETDFSMLPDLIRQVSERQAFGEEPEQEPVNQLSMF